MKHRPLFLACQQLYLPTLMVVYQFTIPMPVYQSSTKTSIFDDFFFPRIFGDFSFSELKSADFAGLECRVVLYNSVEGFSLYKIQSLMLSFFP